MEGLDFQNKLFSPETFGFPNKEIQLGAPEELSTHQLGQSQTCLSSHITENRCTPTIYKVRI